MIFFTSDTGPQRDGGIDPKFFQSAGPFRGVRGDLYEGGLRVPMIVRWPGENSRRSGQRFYLGGLGLFADGDGHCADPTAAER